MGIRAPRVHNVTQAIVPMAFVVTPRALACAKLARQRKRAKAPTVHAVPSCSTRIPKTNAQLAIVAAPERANSTMAPVAALGRIVCPGIAPTAFAVATRAQKHAVLVPQRKKAEASTDNAAISSPEPILTMSAAARAPAMAQPLA